MSEKELDIKKLEKWAENFKAIAHPMRLAIVVMLYGSELLPADQSLSFTHILAVLGLPKSKRVQNSLNYHLDKLIESGFILRKPLQQQPGKTPVRTIYSISDKGREFIGDFNLADVIATSLRKSTT